MKLIRQLIAALNRNSEALDKHTATLDGFEAATDSLSNAALDLQLAGYTLEESVDILKSFKVE